MVKMLGWRRNPGSGLLSVMEAHWGRTFGNHSLSALTISQERCYGQMGWGSNMHRGSPQHMAVMELAHCCCMLQNRLVMWPIRFYNLFVVIRWITMAIKWTNCLCGVAKTQKKVLGLGKTIVKHDHVIMGHSKCGCTAEHLKFTHVRGPNFGTLNLGH